MSWNRSGRGGRHSFLPSGGNFGGGRGGASYGGYGGRDYNQGGYQRRDQVRGYGGRDNGWGRQQRGANRAPGAYAKPTNYGYNRGKGNQQGSYSHANKKRMRPSGGRSHSFKRQKFQNRGAQQDSPDHVELKPKSIVFASGQPGTDKEHCFVTARFKNHPGLRCEPTVRIGKSKFFVRFEIKDLKKGSKAMVSYDVKKPDLADIKAYLGEAFPVIKKKAKETIDLTAVEDEDEKDQGDDVSEVEDIPDDKLDPENMPVKSLRQALARRGLYTRGLKAELIRRLKEYLDAKKGEEATKEGETAEGEAAAKETAAATEESTDKEAAPAQAEGATAKEGEGETEPEDKKKPEGEGEAMEEDAAKEVNGDAQTTEEKPAEEEVVEPEVTQTYTVVLVLKRAPRMKKRFDDLLSRSDIDRTRVVIMEFEATTGGVITPERKKGPKMVIDQAVKGPMALQYEDTVWPEIQEGEGSFKDVVTALIKDRDAFLELETEVNNADKLFMDNQNLKKRVQYLSNELELSKTKCKDLQALINNTVSYLKSNGKTALKPVQPQPEAAEPAPVEAAEPEKAAETTESEAAKANEDTSEVKEK